MYKAFLRPLIDNRDIVYDQPENESFCEKLEQVQVQVYLPICNKIQFLFICIQCFCFYLMISFLYAIPLTILFNYYFFHSKILILYIQ